MLNEKYSLCYAKMKDIDSWIKMVDIVRDNFPELETDEKMDGYRQTVIKNIKRIQPRSLYKKYRFEEDELVTEFEYPLQKFILHKNKQSCSRNL